MKKILFVLGLCLIINACSYTPIPVMRTNAKNPIDMGDKTGSQCALFVFGIFGPFGNVSIPGAAANGGIQKVTYYDVTRKSYFLYSHRCLNVYGY